MNLGQDLIVGLQAVTLQFAPLIFIASVLGLLLIAVLRNCSLTLKRLIALETQLTLEQGRFEQSFSALRVELSQYIRTESDSHTQSLKQELEAIQRRLHEHQQLLLQREGVLSDRLMVYQNEHRAQIEQIANNTTQQLEKLRKLLEDQLQTGLDERLTRSFSAVAERLAQVHSSLGEMNQLAQGVGELQRVLTNVKSRGIWGEVQLEKLLEEVLAPSQFVRNFKPRAKGNDVVEFAVQFPGNEPTQPVWLPIDAKFPLENYRRLNNALEQGNLEEYETSKRLLSQQINQIAKVVSQKYINPPITTDFAVIFLPCESLYAEVLKNHGLIEKLQLEYRVTISGPTTFCALLCSLQMGFRSLQIQERTTEVWRVLAKVRSEFAKFANTLDAVQKKLAQAADQIDEAGRRSQIIQKNLHLIENHQDFDSSALELPKVKNTME